MDRANILIVDDTPANLRLLTELLTRAGYRVRSAINGALALSGAIAQPPALVLLDIMMPDMNGYEVCQHLKNNSRAAKVVFALKTYAHFDRSGQKRLASVPEGIATVLELYTNQLKRGIEVVEIAAPVPPIWCYPDELIQVWTNLIHNAVQAMQGHGRLELGWREQDRGVQVWVMDSGCGTTPEVQARAFEPFFTTKPSGEGSGLGLDIVKRIIDRHAGRIAVESEPGRTRFDLWLPRGAASTPDPETKILTNS